GRPLKSSIFQWDEHSVCLVEREVRITGASSVLRGWNDGRLERNIVVRHTHYAIRLSVSVDAINAVCRDVAVPIEPPVIADAAAAILDRVLLSICLCSVDW